LRELCDARGIVLIYDEVQTGVGRTGEWFFAGSDASDGVVPDIITLAKALGSGVPVGACLVTHEIAAHIRENDLGTTFGGGMIAGTSSDPKVLRLLPPLCLQREEVDLFVETLVQVVSKV